MFFCVVLFYVFTWLVFVSLSMLETTLCVSITRYPEEMGANLLIRKAREESEHVVLDYCCRN